jgi:hypothetical protein
VYFPPLLVQRLQSIEVLGPASALENVGSFLNILLCPCVTIQVNTHVSLHTSYDLLCYIYDVFRLILNPNQGDKYKSIYVCEYKITLPSSTYESHYIQIMTTTDIVLRCCVIYYYYSVHSVDLRTKIED